MSETEPTQQQLDESQRIFEEQFGVVVGHFTLSRAASNGDHPAEVREAWVGLPLPIREMHDPNIETRLSNPDLARVYAFDAFQALVDNDVPEAIRQYWIDYMPRDVPGWVTFDFETSDGEYREQ